MAGNIKGITIEFRGDTSRLDKALRDVGKETKSLDRELRQIDKALKFNPTSVELWSQKQKVLSQRINETEEKLKLLKQAKEKADADPKVDKESEEYRKLCRDIEVTENQLKRFNAELRKVGNVKLKALSEKFKQIGQKATEVGKTLTTKVTAPLAALGAASLKVGSDFDTAMSQVAATMGKSTDEITDLRDFAKEMGSTTAFSATQAAEGLNYMALAGYDAEKSMAMLPTVLNLAAAGSMELGAAADMVTDAQSALGLSTEETVAFIDEMAKASSTTNTSVSQLGEAILTVGGTAKMMKGGTQELSQVLGLLADNGIKGSEGGTALRNILLSLSSPTDKAAAEMDKLNLDVFDANGNMRSMEDIIGDLGSALSGMTDEEKTKAISNIFNKRDLKSVNALLGTSAERWNEVGDAIGNAGGAAEQMAATQLDNMAGSLTLLKSALEGAGIAISDVLAPVVRKIAEFITGLVTKFNELSPQVQKIIVIIGSIVAAIGPLLIVFGAIASGIGSIISLIGMIGPLISGVGAAIGGLMTGSLLPIIAIIGAVIAVGVLLYKNWDTIKAKALALWNTLKTTFNGIKTSIITAWNNIKTSVSNAVNNIRSKVVGTFNAIKGTVTSIWNGIKSAITNPITTAVGIISGAINKIKSIINGANLQLPKFKLPHFRIYGGVLPWGIGGKGTPPSINVDWYAKGGIFDSPHLIGIGERGAEAVVPLDILWKKLDNIADASGGNGAVVVNVYGADNMSVNELAAAVEQRLIQMQKRRSLAWQ